MSLGSEPPPVTPISIIPPGDCIETASIATVTGKSDWCSLYIATFLSFCCAVQFSLYFSSLWPFLQIIDKSSTERFFGSIVAVYSLGQMLSSPVVGYLSNRLRKINGLLYVGVALMFFGNAVYFCPTTATRNISLLKAYASTASVPKDRSRAIAFVTGGVALGMTMGPAFQLLFTPIGYPGWKINLLGVKMRLSMYTAPAYMACAMNLVSAAAIYFLFRESYAGIVPGKSHSITADGQKISLIPKFDPVAVALCHLTRFTQMFVNTNLETIGAPLAAVMFSWTHTQVVEYMATAQAIMSFLAFLTYICFIVFRLDKLMNFRLNCMISLAALIVFHLLTYSYPFLSGHIQTFNSTTVHNKTGALGCNIDRFSWCTLVKPLNPIVFYGCYILIIGPRRQGTQQGILQMSGGSARMIGPVVISSLYTSYGPPSLFYKRMVPLEMHSTKLGPCSVNGSLINNELGSASRGDEQRPFIVITRDKSEGTDQQQDEEDDDNNDQNNTTVSTVCSIRADSVNQKK
uniref:Uncharacterized protein n=1 Tax=Ditylenchus dipsaci TaxID=166011 RepID=A0A915CKZ4_9BILA